MILLLMLVCICIVESLFSGYYFGGCSIVLSLACIILISLTTLLLIYIFCQNYMILINVLTKTNPTSPQGYLLYHNKLLQRTRTLHAQNKQIH